MNDGNMVQREFGYKASSLIDEIYSESKTVGFLVTPRDELGLPDLIDHELTQLIHVGLFEFPSRT